MGLVHCFQDRLTVDSTQVGILIPRVVFLPKLSMDTFTIASLASQFQEIQHHFSSLVLCRGMGDECLHLWQACAHLPPFFF